jgi:hypothetical protein
MRVKFKQGRGSKMRLPPQGRVPPGAAGFAASPGGRGGMAGFSSRRSTMLLADVQGIDLRFTTNVRGTNSIS